MRTCQHVLNSSQKTSFIDLFYNPIHASKLKERLRKDIYTNDENKWIGSSGSNTELFALYCALQEHEIIKKVKNITGAQVFYEEFGLEVGVVKKGAYINSRSFNNPPNKKDSLDFDRFVINLFQLE